MTFGRLEKRRGTGDQLSSPLPDETILSGFIVKTADLHINYGEVISAQARCPICGAPLYHMDGLACDCAPQARRRETPRLSAAGAGTEPLGHPRVGIYSA